jgi:hypothetical protein
MWLWILGAVELSVSALLVALGYDREGGVGLSLALWMLSFAANGRKDHDA